MGNPLNALRLASDLQRLQKLQEEKHLKIKALFYLGITLILGFCAAALAIWSFFETIYHLMSAWPPS